MNISSREAHAQLLLARLQSKAKEREEQSLQRAPKRTAGDSGLHNTDKHKKKKKKKKVKPTETSDVSDSVKDEDPAGDKKKKKKKKKEDSLESGETVCCCYKLLWNCYTKIRGKLLKMLKQHVNLKS